MKKLLMLLFCVVCLAGCTGGMSTAVRDMEKGLSILRSGEVSKFTKNAIIEYENANFAEFNKMIFYSLDYKILSSEEIDKETVKANVDVTMLDITGLQQDVYIDLNNAAALQYSQTDVEQIPDLLPPVFENATNDLIDLIQTWTDEDVRKAIDDDVVPSLDQTAKNAYIASETAKKDSIVGEKLKNGANVPFRTANVDVRLKKVAGVWKICVDEPLYNALIGYGKADDYTTVQRGDFLMYQKEDHTWFMKAAATKPGEVLTHWEPDVSFYFNIIFGIVLILVFAVYLIKKNGGAPQ